jgi:hypothetical protein
MKNIDSGACSFLVRRTRNERIANFGCGAG